MIRSKLQYVWREPLRMLGSTKVHPPQTIFVVINSDCNLRCKMCDIGTKNKDSQFYKNMNTGDELSVRTIEKLVKEVRRFNPLIAIISTEPLLYKNIIDVIKVIRENGLRCQLTTNGFLLPEYSEKLVNSDLDILYVSIDGPKDIHNEIRGNKEAWKNAVDGLRLIDYQKTDKKKKRPLVRINYTISGYNYDKLIDFLKAREKEDLEDEYPIEISKYYGHVDFSHLNVITEDMASIHNLLYPRLKCTPCSINDPKALDINIDVLWDQIQEIKANYSSRFVSFTPDIKTKEELETFYKSPHTFLEKWKTCRVPWNAAQIFSDGSVGVSTRCFHITFGNINKESFMSIWNGEGMRRFRKELGEVGAYPACSRCCGVF